MDDLERFADVPMREARHGLPFLDPSNQLRWDIPETVIVQAAITGSFFSRDHNPRQPYTPEEILSEARRSVEKGAVGVHIHVRDENGIPTGDLKRYRTVIDPLRQDLGDQVIVDGCSVYGSTFEEMMRPVTEGLFEVSPVNCVPQYPPRLLQALCEYMQERGCKPQLAVYDTVSLEIAERHLIRTGIARKPLYWIVLPTINLDWLAGMPMTNPQAMVEGLMFLVNRIKEIDEGSVVMVCAAGRATGYLTTLAMLLGLHVRIGMEDTVWRYPHRDDLLEDNPTAVASAVTIANELGRRVATPEEFRGMIGLPTFSGQAR